MARYNARVQTTFKGPQAKQAVHRGSVNGVNMAIERLRGHSVERAPIDLGDLRDSSSVEQATMGQAAPSALLVFDRPYAAKQHEDETLNHTAGAAGEPAGEAKYVEKNYRDASRKQEYVDIIGKGVSDALGSL